MSVKEVEMKRISDKLTINIDTINDSFSKKYSRYSVSPRHDTELDKLSQEMELRLSPRKSLLSISNNKYKYRRRDSFQNKRNCST